MTVRTRYVITCVLAVTAIVMAAASAPVLKSFGEVSADVVSNQDTRMSMAEPVPYILREYKGKLAVFTPESGNYPAVVTDIECRFLPRGDRELLRAGIGVREQATLASLLEDFGS